MSYILVASILFNIPKVWGQLIIPTLTECETVDILSEDMAGEAWTLAIYFAQGTSPAETVSCNGITCSWEVDFPYNSQVQFCNLLTQECSDTTTIDSGSSTSCLAGNSGASTSVIDSVASSFGELSSTSTTSTSTSSTSSASSSTLAPGVSTTSRSSSSTSTSSTSSGSAKNTSTSSSPSTAATIITPPAGGTSSGSSRHSSTGAIAGGVVGGIVALGLAVLLFTYYNRKATKRRRAQAQAALSGTIYDNSEGGMGDLETVGMEEMSHTRSIVESWKQGIDRANSQDVMTSGDLGAYIRPQARSRGENRNRRSHSETLVPALLKGPSPPTAGVDTQNAQNTTTNTTVETSTDKSAGTRSEENLLGNKTEERKRPKRVPPPVA